MNFCCFNKSKSRLFRFITVFSFWYTVNFNYGFQRRFIIFHFSSKIITFDYTFSNSLLKSMFGSSSQTHRRRFKPGFHMLSWAVQGNLQNFQFPNNILILMKIEIYFPSNVKMFELKLLLSGSSANSFPFFFNAIVRWSMAYSWHL
jgi:hypothetical protein